MMIIVVGSGALPVFHIAHSTMGIIESEMMEHEITFPFRSREIDEPFLFSEIEDIRIEIPIIDGEARIAAARDEPMIPDHRGTDIRKFYDHYYSKTKGG